MKKTLSLFLVLAMLFSLFTGFSLNAFAADDDSNAALEIYTQIGEEGEPTLAKSYSADELAALADTKHDGYSYIYYKNDATNAVVATEYVTLDVLLSDAGVTFAEGDKLSFICSDGPYAKGDFSYETLSARGVDADGDPVPTAVALAWNDGSLSDGTVAEIAADATNNGILRFVSGMTAEEKENQSAAGNRLPTDVLSITVVKSPALEIYTQNGEDGEPTLAKAYTADDLAALAETNADGYGYVYYKNGTSAVVATEYVTLDALFSDAGVAFVAGDKLSFICSDGPYAKGDFSYETLSARGVDADDNPVPTAVALSWADASLSDGTVAEIAANATNSGSLRFLSGMTAEEKENQSAAGNRLPYDLLSITVVKSPALEIYTQVGENGEPTLAKSYYADDLAALAETKANGYGYIYYKNDATNAVVATEYVPLDVLLSDAGVTFAEGDKLSFICSDGPYAKGDFSYETLSARGVDANGNPVPTAVALAWADASLSDGTVAEIAANATNSGSLRFVSGMTAEEKENQSAAGNRLPYDLLSITVVSEEKTALEIYTQNGENGEPVLVNSYTASDLAALAETKADGYGYIYYKNGATNAVAATEYVALDVLLSDAGVTFAAGDKLSFTCIDGAYTKGDFSYENISARGVDADGNPVPTAVALAWNDASLSDGTVAEIAANAANSGSLRFVSGMTAEEKENQSAAGNRLPTDVLSITVVKGPALEIYTQSGDYAQPTLVKSYYADDLAALAETKDDGYGYIYYKSGATNAVVVTEYVTLDALLSDTGVAFASGDKLSFTCLDGAYTKGDFSYENISVRGVDADGNPVPTAVAISYELGNLADGTVAEIAANAYNSGSLRFVSGMTAEEKQNQSAAGNRLPSDVLSITVVSPAPMDFTDVEEGSYYEEAVKWAVQTGVTTGTTATTFSPAADCTRKQVVTFLWRAAGSPEPVTTENPFTDVSQDVYYKAILWAAENEITTGVGDGKFDPDAQVTRRDFVTFLYRYAKAEPVADAASFTDVPAGQYYSDAIAWAAANEITNGTGNNEFSPLKTCSRAEVVTFLYRYFI